MKTNPNPPRRDAERPVVVNAEFRELDEEQAERKFFNGGAFLVLGIAGTGKAREMQTAEQGKRISNDFGFH